MSFWGKKGSRLTHVAESLRDPEYRDGVAASVSERLTYEKCWLGDVSRPPEGQKSREMSHFP